MGTSPACETSWLAIAASGSGVARSRSGRSVAFSGSGVVRVPGRSIRVIVISRDQPDASRLFCLEMIQGAPLLRDELDRELRDLVTRKSEVIRAWVAAGKLAPVDPHHLIFALWATTQHYADFGVQVQAITGRTLDDPEFFEETVANVQRIVLDGIVAH